jgi:DNA-binding transcriptional ArsR family regulator
VARAATTSDAFNAVAEPRRRQILDLLAGGEMSVSELTDRLGIVQPLVSKHLKVLREVGLVQVRDAGRQRLYRLDGRPLRPRHEWVRRFESTWNERFDRMDAVLADLMEDESDEHDDAQRDGGAAQRHPDPDHP